MKIRAVSFRPKALQDIRDIVRYIAVDNSRASHTFEAELEYTVSLLVGVPEMGALRSFGNSALAGIRLWPIKGFEKYLLVYRVSRETLDVIRVVHGARNLPALFRRNRG